jgi:alpha-glucosidase
MVGSDICGYAGVTNDDLCSRWVFIGAFSPFFRDHSDIASPPHELYRTPQIAAAARAAIDIRYRLLDYAYTAMWTQTTTGAPMINPLFFVYPSDIHTANTPYQYFWGDSIMVAPVTDENSTSVDVYFPEDLFYDFFTGALVSGKGNTVTLSNVAFDTIPLYYKGGSIVPQRVSSANTTAQLRQQNFVVVIAPDSNGAASGQLYLDDGDSINQPKSSEITFTYKRGQFSMSGKFGYDAGDVHVTQIRLLGAPSGGRGGSFNAPNKVATYTVNVKLTGNFQMSL